MTYVTVKHNGRCDYTSIVAFVSVVNVDQGECCDQEGRCDRRAVNYDRSSRSDCLCVIAIVKVDRDHCDGGSHCDLEIFAGGFCDFLCAGHCDLTAVIIHAYPGIFVGHQLGGVLVIRIETGRARVSVSRGAGAKGLRPIQTDVDRVADLKTKKNSNFSFLRGSFRGSYLLYGTFWQEINVLVVGVVVIFRGLDESGAGTGR